MALFSEYRIYIRWRAESEATGFCVPAVRHERRTNMTSTLITGANVWDGIADAPAPLQVLVVDGRISRIAETM